ncbi:MAG: DUF58 domain-containing protein [Nanoarchaeota archaeon]|nr:DUF58 domain-containing protein [Nanoarchaeota archaeon]MBU1270493.1 DUF58 domain-containing protein [Nanoarchaeota archaeon]MBU1603871.1 DUF58 domain-containing protein [Nanoarchaeota archaeon]MBU2442722.1 DUF58 domain-containing protein [Nanoarchaeota archaeon]
MAIKELQLDLLAKIKRPEFQVRRKMLSKILEGELAATTKGQGIEFTGFRNYYYGDDASAIDWPASLRSKDILIREFEEYRNFQIFILLDVSNSMLFSSTDRLKCEYAAELVFSIVYSIVNTGNKVGLSLFTDKLVTKQIPNNGTKNYFRILQDLTNPKNYGGQFDIKKPLMQSRALLSDKSLVIIVSDFLGLKEGWNNYIRMMTQQFDVLGIMIRDPRDEEMPRDAGQFLLEDPYSGEKLQIDTKDYYMIYKKMNEEEEEKIRKGFMSSKAGFVSIKTDQDFLLPLMKYVKIRAKMLAKRQQ